MISCIKTSVPDIDAESLTFFNILGFHVDTLSYPLKWNEIRHILFLITDNPPNDEMFFYHNEKILKDQIQNLHRILNSQNDQNPLLLGRTQRLLRNTSHLSIPFLLFSARLLHVIRWHQLQWYIHIVYVYKYIQLKCNNIIRIYYSYLSFPPLTISRNTIMST